MPHPLPGRQCLQVRPASLSRSITRSAMQQTVQLPQSLPGALWIIAGLCVFQRAALVGRDVIALVAFDFILRIAGRGVVRVALVVEVLGVDGNDLPRDMTGLGVPSHMIADFEPLGHCVNSVSPHYKRTSPKESARNFARLPRFARRGARFPKLASLTKET